MQRFQKGVLHLVKYKNVTNKDDAVNGVEPLTENIPCLFLDIVIFTARKYVFLFEKIYIYQFPPLSNRGEVNLGKDIEVQTTIHQNCNLKSSSLIKIFFPSDDIFPKNALFDLN